jgi:hypothetical protein
MHHYQHRHPREYHAIVWTLRPAAAFFLNAFAAAMLPSYLSLYVRTLTMLFAVGALL